MSSAVVARGGGKFLPEPLLLCCRDSPWERWLPCWIVPRSGLVLSHQRCSDACFNSEQKSGDPDKPAPGLGFVVIFGCRKKMHVGVRAVCSIKRCQGQVTKSSKLSWVCSQTTLSESLCLFSCDVRFVTLSCEGTGGSRFSEGQPAFMGVVLIRKGLNPLRFKISQDQIRECPKPPHSFQEEKGVTTRFRTEGVCSYPVFNY